MEFPTSIRISHLLFIQKRILHIPVKTTPAHNSNHSTAKKGCPLFSWHPMCGKIFLLKNPISKVIIYLTRQPEDSSNLSAW